MSDWFYRITLGGSIRVAECLISSGPTLLVGLLIAAVLRFYLGPQGTKRLFGGDSLRALPQSWAVGMLLPVCSIGVLPVLMEMRRSRIKPGALSAFALSAPLFNPLSLLYGLTLSRPYVIVMFAVGSLVVVTSVGMVWDAIYRNDSKDTSCEPTESNDSLGLIGVKRLAGMAVYVGRQLFGPVGAWALVASLGMFILALALPWGALGHSFSRDDWWAPARMAFVAVPVYSTPMLAMSQLGMMFQHANSPGAAFILLVVGAGLNLATLAWLGRQFGMRSVMIWSVCFMTIVVGIAYAINEPLIPPGVDPSDHTHAFDVYTNAVHPTDTGSFAIDKLNEKFGLVEQITATLVGLGLLLGLAFRITGIDQESWSSNAVGEPQGNNQIERMDRIVSPQTVGGTLLVGLVTISIVMCYAYYPSPEECLKEIRFVRADVLSASLSGDNDHAKFWIPRWDEWSRRLEVGTFLRRGHVTPYQRMQGYLIRKKLEVLEHELEHDHPDSREMRELVTDIMATDSRWVRAFRKSTAPAKASVSSVPMIDPNADSLHDHRHFHDESQTHEHEHPDQFVGGHDHDHVHGHRHSDPPHGGTIVNLGHDRHQPDDIAMHLEVMPFLDHQVVIYALKEQLGRFRPLRSESEPGELVLRIRSQDSTDESRISMSWDRENSKYTGELPLTLEVVNEFDIVAEYTREGKTIRSEFQISDNE